MPTAAEKKAIKKYHAKFDTVITRFQKGEKQGIANHAAAHGESLMKFVRRAVYETMERDRERDRENNSREM